MTKPLHVIHLKLRKEKTFMCGSMLSTNQLLNHEIQAKRTKSATHPLLREINKGKGRNRIEKRKKMESKNKEPMNPHVKENRKKEEKAKLIPCTRTVAV